MKKILGPSALLLMLAVGARAQSAEADHAVNRFLQFIQADQPHIALSFTSGPARAYLNVPENYRAFSSEIRKAGTDIGYAHWKAAGRAYKVDVTNQGEPFAKLTVKCRTRSGERRCDVDDIQK